MQHHTAPPVPFPVDRLYPPGAGYDIINGQRVYRIKANWNVKPDGTVHVIAAGACNYSSGPGSSVVLGETMRSIAPSGLAVTRMLRDDTSGNSWYLNNETDHVGNGGPIPAAQLDAVVRCWAAICVRLDWTPARIVAHAEWTARKIDPRWNGQDAHEALLSIRAATAALFSGDTEEDYLYPINLKDGSEEQRPTANGFIRSMQAKLRQMGVKGGGTGGVAFRGFLDAVFGVVGSPLGGSWISGEEGAAFDFAWLQALGTPGAPGPAGPVGKTGPRGPAGPSGVDGAKVQITVDDVVVHP
jgi:hypothetical protein